MGLETNAATQTDLSGAASADSGIDLGAHHTASSLSPATDAASADFVRAVSDLLDTDPSDLLVELGYYDRDGAAA
jgi:hypothetical protein